MKHSGGVRVNTTGSAVFVLVAVHNVHMLDYGMVWYGMVWYGMDYGIMEVWICYHVTTRSKCTWVLEEISTFLVIGCILRAAGSSY